MQRGETSNLIDPSLHNALLGGKTFLFYLIFECLILRQVLVLKFQLGNLKV